MTEGDEADRFYVIVSGSVQVRSSGTWITALRFLKVSIPELPHSYLEYDPPSPIYLSF